MQYEEDCVASTSAFHRETCKVVMKKFEIPLITSRMGNVIEKLLPSILHQT